MSDRRSDERDHLFISYAWEDGALASWLTLRLTAEGYLVWCDRFKLLGGESWPEDIDEAIKKRTFRMLHIVSRHSLHKPSPTKERTLALALQKERGSELFIPLNADGTKPSDLPWQISDIVFVPFERWETGLQQLLEKLEKVEAPRPLRDSGRAIAANACAPPDVVTDKPEQVFSNCFPFASIPAAILRFTCKPQDADRISDRLSSTWPHRQASETMFLSLVAPPHSPEANLLIPAGGVSWRDVDSAGGLTTNSVLVEILNKSVSLRLQARGLKKIVGGRTPDVVYFPDGLVPRNRLTLQLPDGGKTWVATCGRLRSGASHFRYNLGFQLRTRRVGDDQFYAQMNLKAFIRDDAGQPVDGLLGFRRGRRVRRTWWNRQQLLRQTGIMSFLASGQGIVRLSEDAGVEFTIAAQPASFGVNQSLNEDAVALSGEDVAPLENDDHLDGVGE